MLLVISRQCSLYTAFVSFPCCTPVEHGLAVLHFNERRNRNDAQTENGYTPIDQCAKMLQAQNYFLHDYKLHFHLRYVGWICDLAQRRCGNISTKIHQQVCTDTNKHWQQHNWWTGQKTSTAKACQQSSSKIACTTGAVCSNSSHHEVLKTSNPVNTDQCKTTFEQLLLFSLG